MTEPKHAVVAPVSATDSDSSKGESPGPGDAPFLADVPSDVPSLDLTHCRLRTLADLDLKRFAQLTQFSARQNLLAEVGDVLSADAPLEELDLYDNKLTEVPALAFSAFSKSLTSLDLSFNKIREMIDFSCLPNLETLYLAANRIREIRGLEGLTQLRSLELGSNKIKSLKGLPSLPLLEELWLGKNRLVSLDDLPALPRLRILALQSNEIVRFEQVRELPVLEELYLSHNRVSDLADAASLPKLLILDFGTNFVASLPDFKLPALLELWGNNNKLTGWGELSAKLAPLAATLETIYLEGNPVATEMGATYRPKLSLSLPKLVQIDATFCVPVRITTE